MNVTNNQRQDNRQGSDDRIGDSRGNGIPIWLMIAITGLGFLAGALFARHKESIRTQWMKPAVEARQ